MVAAIALEACSCLRYMLAWRAPEVRVISDLHWMKHKSEARAGARDESAFVVAATARRFVLHGRPDAVLRRVIGHHGGALLYAKSIMHLAN